MLEREKALVLRSIKELEFDHAMGKVSDADFAEIGGAAARAGAGRSWRTLDARRRRRRRRRARRQPTPQAELRRDRATCAGVRHAPTTPTRGSASSADAKLVSRRTR